MPTRKNKKNRKRTIKMRGGRPDSEMNKLFDYALKILNMVDGKIKDVKTITQLERLFEESSVQQLLYDSPNRESIVSANRDSIVSTNRDSIVSANVENNETDDDDDDNETDDDDDDNEAKFDTLLQQIRVFNSSSDYNANTTPIKNAEKLILKMDEIMNVPQKKEQWEYDKKYIKYSKTLNEIAILIVGNKNIDKNKAKQDIERDFNLLSDRDKGSVKSNMDRFLKNIDEYTINQN